LTELLLNQCITLKSQHDMLFILYHFSYASVYFDDNNINLLSFSISSGLFLSMEPLFLLWST